MSKRKLAKSNEEFDIRFDQGEDIHDLIDLSKATITKPGKQVRITIDISESLIKEREMGLGRIPGLTVAL